MLFFGKFPVTKKFTDKNGGGEYEDIPSKISCLTVSPRRGTPQYFTNCWNRKNLCFRVLCDNFPSKLFCLKVPKNAVGESFSLLLS